MCTMRYLANRVKVFALCPYLTFDYMINELSDFINFKEESEVAKHICHDIPSLKHNS